MINITVRTTEDPVDILKDQLTTKYFHWSLYCSLHLGHGGDLDNQYEEKVNSRETASN